MIQSKFNTLFKKLSLIFLERRIDNKNKSSSSAKKKLIIKLDYNI